MTIKTISDSPEWKQFESEARKRRAQSVRFLRDYMKECVEVLEHERLDEEISRQAQNSGYTEGDAVEIVKHYRLEKKRRWPLVTIASGLCPTRTFLCPSILEITETRR
jgi:hypothetical protein